MPKNWEVLRYVWEALDGEEMDRKADGVRWIFLLVQIGLEFSGRDWKTLRKLCKPTRRKKRTRLIPTERPFAAGEAAIPPEALD